MPASTTYTIINPNPPLNFKRMVEHELSQNNFAILYTVTAKLTIYVHLNTNILLGCAIIFTVYII